MNPSAPAQSPSRTLVELVYELLDAHHDSGQLLTQLALGRAADPVQLQAHLEYLRALQRTGRELLAHTTARVER